MPHNPITGRAQWTSTNARARLQALAMAKDCVPAFAELILATERRFQEEYLLVASRQPALRWEQGDAFNSIIRGVVQGNKMAQEFPGAVAEILEGARRLSLQGFSRAISEENRFFNARIRNILQADFLQRGAT